MWGYKQVMKELQERCFLDRRKNPLVGSRFFFVVNLPMKSYHKNLHFSCTYKFLKKVFGNGVNILRIEDLGPAFRASKDRICVQYKLRDLPCRRWFTYYTNNSLLFYLRDLPNFLCTTSKTHKSKFCSSSCEISIR